MRKITIIGGGQSGLHLGIGLLHNGYDVEVVQNRTGEEIAAGKVLSSQCMFDNALQLERDLDLAFWDEACPDVDGVGLEVMAPDTQKAVSWKYRLDAAAQSTDQRVKIPRWMQVFEERGGKLTIMDAGIKELEQFAASSDLVVVASGKGEISKMFERDAEKSAFDKPMRALALTYVHGMQAQDDFSRVGFNIMPGLGEYFSFPAYTLSGPCDIMVFEGLVGGEMDCWQDVHTPADHLVRSKEILHRYLPHEAARCEKLELTDANGVLAGRFPPTIRKPIGQLPSGATVLGMADAIALNDPITGQGSNNAAKCANIYLQSIIAQGDQAFDTAWMSQTFTQYWDYAKWVVQWTNAFLLPPEPHVMNILGAAQQDPRVGKAFVNGFNHPPSYFPWFAEPAEADRFLQAV